MARALKISYLPFRAMAEPTRLILRFGGVPYTDELVWGPVFSRRRQQGDYPFGKVLLPRDTDDSSLGLASPD